MSFSQRHGLKPLKTVIQTDSMDSELRNGLWNALSGTILSDAARGTSHYGVIRLNTLAHGLVLGLWCDYFKRLVDDLPKDWGDAYDEIKAHFLSCEWNEVYDLLEFLAQRFGADEFFETCNEVMARELAGFRFIGDLITPVTSEAELSAIEEALQNTQPLRPVQEQLRQALALLANRKAPDYRNSIKESISAVEGVCKLIAGMPQATLGPALQAVEKKLALHKSLKEGFHKLYGYTSDAQGIRHALMDEPSLDLEDAVFMLVACSSFINYLIVKATKAGITL